MNNRIPPIIFFFLLVICLTGQNKPDTLRLFFGVNQTQSEQNNQRIDSLLSKLNGKIVKVKIFGYADFLNSNAFNLTLSQKRAESVKTYLLKKANPSQINLISCKGLGEKLSGDNGSATGDAFYRRVDVIVEPFIIVQTNDHVPDTTRKQIQNIKTIETLSEGESLAVEGLNFIPGRHFIVKEAIPVLNNLLKILQENKTLKIEIQGHICCVDGGEDGMDLDTHEKKLSENRAKSVYAFLVKNGISSERLTYKGYGRSMPKVSPETSPAEEQINRRVEVKVIEK